MHVVKAQIGALLRVSTNLICSHGSRSLRGRRAGILVLPVAALIRPRRIIHAIARRLHVLSECRRHGYNLLQMALSYLRWPTALVLLGVEHGECNCSLES
jgi:hypothetical protein